MNWDAIVAISQLVAAVGVILSLVFVGLQVRQNTAALQRNEHNSTMAEWSVIRMAIAGNRDIADLMTAGLNAERSIDAADQLRLEQMLAEYAWACFHIWDRTQRAVFPKGTFELTAGPFLRSLLGTARGGAWWRNTKHVGFIPRFVVDVDALLGEQREEFVGRNPERHSVKT